MSLSWAAGSFCSTPGAPPALSSLPAGLLLSHCSPTSQLLCSLFFFTFPCYHSGATSITSGLELAMFSMGQLLESSHRGCPCSPSAVNNWSQAAIIPPVLFLPFLLCECSKPLVALAGDCGHLSKFQPADHFTLCAVEQTVA